MITPISYSVANKNNIIGDPMYTAFTKVNTNFNTLQTEIDYINTELIDVTYLQTGSTYPITSSYAITASYAMNGGSGGGGGGGGGTPTGGNGGNGGNGLIIVITTF